MALPCNLSHRASFESHDKNAPSKSGTKQLVPLHLPWRSALAGSVVDLTQFTQTDRGNALLFVAYTKTTFATLKLGGYLQKIIHSSFWWLGKVGPQVFTEVPWRAGRPQDDSQRGPDRIVRSSPRSSPATCIPPVRSATARSSWSAAFSPAGMSLMKEDTCDPWGNLRSFQSAASTFAKCDFPEP